MWWNNEYYEGWQIKFAWFPVCIDGGETIWLEKYRQRFVRQNKSCECKGCQHVVGTWDIERIIK